jgi:hypothetical protein
MRKDEKTRGRRETVETEEMKTIIRRAWEGGTNEGELWVADEIFTASYVLHSAGSPDLHARAHVK